MVCVLDTNTMAVQNIDEVFFSYDKPAAFWNHTRRIVAGYRVGGIDGGVLVYPPATEDFEAMHRDIDEYMMPADSAEQDFLTDYWLQKFQRIDLLQLKLNMQVPYGGRDGKEALMLQEPYGEVDYQDSVSMVKNWHFISHPKPIDFLFRSVSASSQAARLQTQTYNVSNMMEEFRSRRLQTQTHQTADDAAANHEIACEAIEAWLMSFLDNVWPNIVWAVHDEVGRRSESQEGQLCCRLCGNTPNAVMDHNLFSCSAIAHDHELWQMSWENWRTITANPFRLAPGAQNVIAIMRYYGLLLDSIVDHTAAHGEIQQVKPEHMRLASDIAEDTAFTRHTRIFNHE